MTYQARDEVSYSDGSTAQRVAPVTTAGAPVNPAREDGNLAGLLEAADYVVSAAYRVTIDGTSRLIAGAPGAGVCVGAPASLPDGLVRLGLVKEDGETDNIHFAFGAAAVAPPNSNPTPQWPAGGVASMPIAATLARTMRVIASGGTIYATLLVMTGRA